MDTGQHHHPVDADVACSLPVPAPVSHVLILASLQSYNEDVEDYQLLEDRSVQISSDDEGAIADGSWRGGAAKRGAKRKHGATPAGSRCSRCFRLLPRLMPADYTWCCGIAGVVGLC